MLRPFMRHLLTWLILLGVLAGLQSRVCAADPCDVIEKMHAQEHSGHDHDPGKPCDPSHDKDCPLEHHSHGCLCHAMPLVPASDPISLQVPCRSLARLAHDGENPPDGPFLSEDKPPLI
jgi:hypothetical protein